MTELQTRVVPSRVRRALGHSRAHDKVVLPRLPQASQYRRKGRGQREGRQGVGARCVFGRVDRRGNRSWRLRMARLRFVYGPKGDRFMFFGGVAGRAHGVVLFTETGMGMGGWLFAGGQMIAWCLVLLL